MEQVDILKFVDHDVFQPPLPFQPDVVVLLENIQGKLDEVVVIEAEAFLFLIQIAVEDDVRSRRGFVVLLFQPLQRHRNHVGVIFRFLDELAHFYHIPGGGKGHIAQRQPPFFVNHLEHGVDIGIIEDEKILGILDGVAVFLQDRYAEAVERIDVARVVVACQVVNAPTHFRRRLIRKGDAEDVARQDAQLVD